MLLTFPWWWSKCDIGKTKQLTIEYVCTLTFNYNEASWCMALGNGEFVCPSHCSSQAVLSGVLCPRLLDMLASVEGPQIVGWFGFLLSHSMAVFLLCHWVLHRN